eukprot:CAMPEP_0185780044 /NCGR_PEP_ID=MMETSP1174-20130828/97839_1 /TAXON_ID=35687 /ORGANISM="Dictyocha speculum, Strain CCMP1381" /LENGTH=142 /DNA_ID=CAMNT_0028469443 /DNA_START=187 /DNA_END=612 /DNA_ORIENTATION=-
MPTALKGLAKKEAASATAAVSSKNLQQSAPTPTNDAGHPTEVNQALDFVFPQRTRWGVTLEETQQGTCIVQSLDSDRESGGSDLRGFAERIGIKCGDVIEKVNKKVVLGWSLVHIIELVKSESIPITISMLRPTPLHQPGMA